MKHHHKCQDCEKEYECKCPDPSPWFRLCDVCIDKMANADLSDLVNDE